MRARTLRAVLLVVAVAAPAAVSVLDAGPAGAATCALQWVGPANGDWSKATNWSPAQVPTAVSDACISTMAGPSVRHGYTAYAGSLFMTNGAVQVNGTLRIGTANLTNSNVTGRGTVIAGGPANVLSGVQVSDSVFVSVYRPQLSGARAMCGQQLTLCVNDTSVVSAGEALELDGASIGGTAEAPGGVFAPELVIVGSGKTNRIRASVNTYAVVADRHASGNTLRFDRWDKLSKDGVLTGSLEIGDNTVVLPRPVTVVQAPVQAEQGRIQTLDGADALRYLTKIGPVRTGPIGLPADVTPGTGTLAVVGYTTFAATSTPVTVHGALTVTGALTAATVLHADSLVSSGTTRIADHSSLTVATASFPHGVLQMDNDSTLTAPGGVTLDRSLTGNSYVTCATIDGDVTTTERNQLDLTLNPPVAGCPAMFTTTGVFQLTGELDIDFRSRVDTDGTRIVLIDAAGGLQGSFSRVRQVGNPAGSWTIKYTATQAIATFTAGTN